MHKQEAGALYEVKEEIKKRIQKEASEEKLVSIKEVNPWLNSQRSVHAKGSVVRGIVLSLEDKYAIGDILGEGDAVSLRSRGFRCCEDRSKPSKWSSCGCQVHLEGRSPSQLQGTSLRQA